MGMAHGRLCVVVAGVVGVWLSGAVFGQSSDAPLAGPKVESREVPGVREEYVPSVGTRVFGGTQNVPLIAFLQGLQELHSDEVEAKVRLTDEQVVAIGDEVGRFGVELAAFLDAHGEEVREMLRALPEDQRGRAAGELRGAERAVTVLDRVQRRGGVFGETGRRAQRSMDGGAAREADEPTRASEDSAGFRLRFDAAPAEPEADAGMMTMMAAGEMVEDSGAAAGTRLAELRAAAPSVAGLQTRVWEMLSPAQQEVFGATLDGYLAEERARLEENRLEREIARREAAAAQRAAERGTDVTRGAGSVRDAGRLSDAMVERVLGELKLGDIPQRVWDRLPERVRDRLGALPEEERAAALARWLQELRDTRRGG